jgi:hypothetical protein
MKREKERENKVKGFYLFSEVKMILLGRISRCTMFFPCAICKAARISRAIGLT